MLRLAKVYINVICTSEELLCYETHLSNIYLELISVFFECTKVCWVRTVNSIDFGSLSIVEHHPDLSIPYTLHNVNLYRPLTFTYSYFVLIRSNYKCSVLKRFVLSLHNTVKVKWFSIKKQIKIRFVRYPRYMY